LDATFALERLAALVGKEPPLAELEQLLKALQMFKAASKDSGAFAEEIKHLEQRMARRSLN
jgi:hypothetical protein